MKTIVELKKYSLLSQYLRDTGVDGLPDKIVTDTLKEYAGYIDINGDIVRFTKKGLNELQKSKHDWD